VAVAIAANIQGDEFVTINSVGGTAAGANILGYVQMTPTVGGPEQVTFTGDLKLDVGTVARGALADVQGGLLELNNLRVIDQNTGVVVLLGAGTTGGVPLSFAAPNDVTTFTGATHGYSTNAVFIDATASGGLIMLAGDANVGVGTLNTIKGSLTAGNVLGGSIGKDVFTVSTSDVANTVYTDGGADSITLPGSHTTSQHIGLYTGVNTANMLPGGVENGQAGSITSIGAANPNADVPRIGNWGSDFGSTPTGHTGGGVYNGLANGTGTSASMTVVAGGANAFVPNTDVLDFAAGAWFGSGAARSLTNGTLGIATVGTPSTAAGELVTPNGALPTAANTVLAGTTLIVLDGVHANASSVAAAFHDILNPIFFTNGAGLNPGQSAHMLVAYNDGIQARIADLDLFNATGAVQVVSSAMDVHASDMVQLVGVSLSAFAGNQSNTALTPVNSVHFVATGA
jgi:hypothetical protein